MVLYKTFKFANPPINNASSSGVHNVLSGSSQNADRVETREWLKLPFQAGVL